MSKRERKKKGKESSAKRQRARVAKLPRKLEDFYLDDDAMEIMIREFGDEIDVLEYYDPVNDPQHRHLHSLPDGGDLVVRKPILNLDAHETVDTRLLTSDEIISAYKFYRYVHAADFDYENLVVHATDNPKDLEIFDIEDLHHAVIFFNTGNHWVLIRRVEDEIQYFDPFGVPPRNKKIAKFLKHRNSVINKVQWQHGAVECGMHCLIQALDLDPANDATMTEYRHNFFRVQKMVSEVIVLD